MGGPIFFPENIKAITPNTGVKPLQHYFFSKTICPFSSISLQYCFGEHSAPIISNPNSIK